MSKIPAMNLSSIEGYRAKIQALGGLQRSHRFEVFIQQPVIGVFTWPPVTISLPGRSFDTIPDELLAQGTNPRNIPIKRSYGGEPNILMTFPMDQQWKVRQFFERWMDLNLAITKEEGNIPAMSTSTGALFKGQFSSRGSEGSYDLLTGDCTVSVRFLDKQDQVRWSLNLVEPYLSMIVQDQYGAESVNEFATMTVSIAFKEYVTWEHDKLQIASDLNEAATTEASNYSG